MAKYTEGLDGSARLNYSRAKRGKLTSEQEAKVNEQAGREGFALQTEVQSFILEQFDVCLAKSNVSKLLQHLEVTAKVPRPLNRRICFILNLAYNYQPDG